jgi:hypothetical protein
MIYERNRVECLGGKTRAASRLDNTTYVMALAFGAGSVRVKYLRVHPRRVYQTPYRLRSSSAHVDVYLTTRVLVAKPDGVTVFRRLTEVRYDHRLARWSGSELHYESVVSLLQDPVKARMYVLELDNERHPQYDAVVANGFVVKAVP